jgi:hypothetical protein
MAWLLATASSSGLAKELAGPEIRDLIAGKRVYLAVPLGGEFPLYYQTNGQVNGSGDAVGLGRFLKPNDSGRWWVDGNKLCQKWMTWYDGKPFCFQIVDQGSDRIGWIRDDGYSGTARISR